MYGNSNQPQTKQQGTQHGQQSKGQERQYPSSVIAVINGRDKVIDFRDNLNPASKLDYAMMHGEGGKNHARVSTIKLVLCDYSAGTGQGVSKTVSCNIDVATTYRILDAARYFWLERIKDQSAPLPAANNLPVIPQSGITKLQTAHSELSKAYKQIKSWQDSGETAKLADVLEMLSPVGTNIKDAIHEIRKPTTPASQPSSGTGTVQIVSQDKIILPNKDENGKSLVTKLSVVRQDRAQNGQRRTYPWIFTITNARALGKTQQNGGTTYDSSTMSDEVTLNIFASDEDVWRCMVRVTRFIETWENVFCLGDIQEAVSNRLAWIDAQQK